MGPHWPQDGPYGVPTVICRHNRNFHFLGKIEDRGDSRKFEFWRMVIFCGFDPFFGPNETHWPQDGPYRVPTLIWRHNRNFHFLQKNRWPRGSWKCEFLGMVIFYVSDPFFNPMGPHWPQDWTHWVPTVIWHHNRNFHFLQKIDGSRKFEFWGMVIFYAFDLFFGPNGTHWPHEGP